ncbi:hypothetical protein M1373_00915 [Candidatus Marsarchaeota archaeon]|nr:hypothetical protein [Candidatus Marsarchaeota archaeon]MCL5404228.1 hypothetical protein [Candidatus Marsarchaeota archaeon]
MPIKYNRTNYDMLVGEIHKLVLKCNAHQAYSALQQKHNGVELEKNEQSLKALAVIIASFSSSHSWQTHKCLESRNGRFDTAEIKNEYLEAENSRWKNVSIYDLEELASIPVPTSIFYRWLFLNVDKSKQQLYKNAWKELQKVFEGACDELEQSSN